MASLVFRLDERSKKNGLLQVCIRISHKHTSSVIATGVYVTKENFMGDLFHPIRCNTRKDSDNMEALCKYVDEFNNIVQELDECGRLDSVSANEIREYIGGGKVRKRISFTFTEWYKRYTSNLENENTKKNYEYVGRIIDEYTGGRNLLFRDVNYGFLQDMHTWMKKTGRGESTIYKLESYTKAVYNDAVRRKYARFENNPFNEYKIKRPEENYEIETMSIDGLRRLFSIDLSSQQGEMSLTRTRDILLLCICMSGVNLIDIYNMEKCSGEEVVFIRHKIDGKTNRPVRIYKDNELSQLIDKYKGKSHMFSFCESKGNYQTFQRNVTNRCDRLSVIVGEKVNMAIIRRTWATIAAELEIPDRVIDKSMGHKDANVKDKYYERYDWSKTRRANRMVLDYIMSGVVPNSVKVPAFVRDMK